MKALFLFLVLVPTLGLAAGSMMGSIEVPKLKCRIAPAKNKKEVEKLSCGPTTATLEEQIENLIRASELKEYNKKAEAAAQIPEDFIDGMRKSSLKSAFSIFGVSSATSDLMIKEYKLIIQKLEKSKLDIKTFFDMEGELKNQFGEKLTSLAMALKSDHKYLTENYKQAGTPEYQEKYQAFGKKTKEYNLVLEEMTQKVKQAQGESASSPGGFASGSADTFEEYKEEIKNTSTILDQYIKEYQKKIKSIETIKSNAEKTASQGDGKTDEERQQIIEGIKMAVARYREDNDFVDCGLTDAELFSILLYTGSGYREINAALRTKNTKVLDREAHLITAINSGLSKLEPYKGYVKRGATLSSEDLKAYCEGCEVRMEAFTSTSAKNGFPSPHRFIIKSKTGVYVEPISSARGEDEVLFKSDTKFKVLTVEDNVYLMEEVDEEKYIP